MYGNLIITLFWIELFNFFATLYVIKYRFSYLEIRIKSFIILNIYKSIEFS